MIPLEHPGPDEPAAQLGNRLLVIYDGYCALCNGFIRWLIRRDRDDRLRFIPSQSPAVASLLAAFPQERARSGIPNSVAVVRNPFTPHPELFFRSRAVLAALRVLPQPWPAVAGLAGIVPALIADPIYRLIARLRYSIWGKLKSCPIPTPTERAHFL